MNIEFIGYKSGAANTTGEENTFLGYDSGLSNITGYENTFIGYRSGRINTIGSENTFLGYDSGRLNTEGKENTFLGTESGYWNETGNHNVMVGYRAGLLNVEGDSSIFLGYEAGHNETGSNKLYIENSSSSLPLIYGEFDNDLVTINGQFSVIDTVTLSSALIVNGKNLANTAFTSENNITYAINNDDDFVIGADSLNWGSGTEPKLFFDKSKGAFRTGRAFNSNWDEDNIGDYSVAWGYGCKASGDYATAWGLSSATDDFATAWGHDNSATGSASTVWGDDNSATGSTSTVWGYDNSASGATSTVWGYDNSASGATSTVWGDDNVASGRNSTIWGEGSEAFSYAETVMGTYATNYTGFNATSFISDDRLFVIGNGTSSSNRSDAMIVYKSGDIEINGNLTVQDTINGGNDTVLVNDVLVLKNDLIIENSKIGTDEYITTFKNTKNDNSEKNNGINILAGHITFDANYKSRFINFSTPDGNNVGRVQQNSGGVAYNQTSDIRLKANIQPTQYGLSDILNIEVKDYHYKKDQSKIPQTGFIAQQLHQVYPNAVTVGGDDEKTNPWMVDYSNLTPLLVKGMQEQQEVIEQQNKKIEKQQAQIEALEAQVEKINELEAKLEAFSNTFQSVNTK